MPTQLTDTKSIEDILHDKELITDDQLSAIKFENINTGKPVTQIIKEHNYVSELDFIKAYGESYGIPFVSLRDKEIDPSLMDYVTIDLAKNQQVIPFEYDKEKNKLSLAMVDPLDLPTIEFIEKKENVHVKPFITTPGEISHVLGDLQGRAIGEEISAALEEINQTTLKLDETSEEISTATLRDAPIARIVGMILETAVKTGASDIHIEPHEDSTRLRYRIDGVLEEKRTLPKQMHDPVVARIKILANMKLDEKRKPLDGRFKVQVGDTATDLRVSTLPTVNGEKVVIRLLQDEGSVHSFKDLGLRGLSLKRVEEAILKPTGMLLVTGPTSSGKTVTLAAALNKLNTVRVNIMTLEDPVEIRIPGVNQVQVNPQAGLTFANGLRAFLRQDPNVIMVGEIRDGETAELAIHAALTGHMVLATLHTNSSAGALPRLLDMDIEDYLLVSTVNAIVAQRLVRRICPVCKTEIDPPEEVKQQIKGIMHGMEESKLLSQSKDKQLIESLKKLRNNDIKLYRGKGCDECNGTGYSGRVGIFEVLSMSEALSELVLDHASAGKLHQQAQAEGMLSLQQDGVLRVLEGTTTLEEVMRVAK
ncbi:type II/IV secretion system protein [candidate division WWE3 bacterium]|nr:type II/IV secretion system protein [candidate division WWE3 bacterium]